MGRRRCSRYFNEDIPEANCETCQRVWTSWCPFRDLTKGIPKPDGWKDSIRFDASLYRVKNTSPIMYETVSRERRVPTVTKYENNPFSHATERKKWIEWNKDNIPGYWREMTDKEKSKELYKDNPYDYLTQRKQWVEWNDKNIPDWDRRFKFSRIVAGKKTFTYPRHCGKRMKRIYRQVTFINEPAGKRGTKYQPIGYVCEICGDVFFEKGVMEFEKEGDNGRRNENVLELQIQG
jgi:hypothetical protein